MYVYITFGHLKQCIPRWCQRNVFIFHWNSSPLHILPPLSRHTDIVIKQQQKAKNSAMSTSELTLSLRAKCKSFHVLKHRDSHGTHEVYLSFYLSIYGSTALVDLGRFFSFLIYTQSVRLLGRWISPAQGRYLHTVQHKHKINAHWHSCLEWDSNPPSQRLSERRQFMP
jgi:hypothetical protein